MVRIVPALATRVENRPLTRGHFFGKLSLKVAAAVVAVAGLVFVRCYFTSHTICRVPINPAPVVRSAVQSWRLTNEDKCPDVAHLVSSGILDPEAVHQFPEESFRIQCDGSGVTVVWSGPDGTFGTPDDRRAAERD